MIIGNIYNTLFFSYNVINVTHKNIYWFRKKYITNISKKIKNKKLQKQQLL